MRKQEAHFRISLLRCTATHLPFQMKWLLSVANIIVLIVSANATAGRSNPSHKLKRPSKGTVIDLCTLPLQDAGKGYAKQKIVIFDLGGEETTNAPEGELNRKGERIKGRKHFIMRNIGAHRHVKNAFFSAFPLERHHMVAATVVAPETLTKNASVSNEEMIRAAGLDSFAAYSIACADWVVVPRIVKKKADWRQVKRTRKKGKKKIEYWVWSLSLRLDIEVTAFRFDGTAWEFMGTERSNSILVDIGAPIEAAGESLHGISKAMSDSESVTTYFSAMPEPTCKVPLWDDVKSIADGFGACTTAITGFSSNLQNILDTDKRNRARIEEEKRRDSENQAENKETNSDDGAEASISESDESGKTANKNDVPPDEQSEKNTSSATVVDEKKTGEDIGESATPNQAEPDPLLTEEHVELLTSLINDPSRDGIRQFAEQELGESVPYGIRNAVDSAQKTAETCKGGVENVVQLSKTLRKIGASPMGAAKDAALGFAACAGIPLSYDLGEATPPGMEQQKSKYCTNINADVKRGMVAMRAVAVCQSRVSTEHTAITSRRDATNAWWRIKVPLLQCDEDVKSRTFCIATGEKEGIRRGHVFEVFKDDDRVGFGMVTRTGSGGGAKGEQNPSLFRFRGGRGESGDAVVERAKIGMELGVKPLVNYIVMSDNLSSSLMYGGALEAGYNAGRFVKVGDEFWIRSHVGFLVGQDDEMLLSVSALPEAQYYLFPRVAAFVQIGAAMDYVMKKIDDSNYSGFSFGAVMGVGFDIALHPDLYFRLGVLYNQGVIKTELNRDEEDDDENTEAPGAETDPAADSLNLGRLGILTGSASINYHF